MKKNIVYFLIMCLLLANMFIGVFADDNPAEKSVKAFKAAVEQHGDFAVWKGEKLSNRIELFNSKGDLSAFLFNVENKEDIVGYFLVEPTNYTVIEYALGESPYSGYLNSYISKKEDIYKGRSLRLIYDGPSAYGVAVNGKMSNHNTSYFTSDNNTSIDADTTGAVEKLAKEKGIKLNGTTDKTNKSNNMLDSITRGSYYEKKLSVGYFRVGSEGCGPNAGYTIIDYWDRNGYPNLIASSDTETTVEAVLGNSMGSFPIGGGQVATLPDGYINGLSGYIVSKYSTAPLWNASIDKTFANVKSEINNNRPSTILYWGHPYFGYHYVVVTGYQTTVADINYYIIHDGWTSNDVYRNWENDVNYMSVLVKTYAH